MPPRRHRQRDDPPTARPPAVPVDVLDRPREYRVIADLPGLRTRDIDVRVRTNRLRILADLGDAAARYPRRERERGRVDRTVVLPGPVNARRVTAAYHDGVLRVSVPKR